MSEKSDSKRLAVFDLGEVSKPLTVLVERCCDVIGGAFLPFQIKRLAQAEAQAEKIRVRGEETRKQVNMENILRGADPLLSETAKPADIESDWIANFFEKCRLVSDEQMQTIWSRILANEANN